MSHNNISISLFEDIINNNGPDIHQYSQINSYINSLTNEDEITNLKDKITFILKAKNTVFGHAFEKPFGYAGDYLLIEKLYQKYVSKDNSFTKWDEFFHSHCATEAVRNRKTFFINKMDSINKNPKVQLRVLILGSGPATDVYEYLNISKASNVIFDLLDIDQRAIEYAAAKNKIFKNNLNFIKSNVLRLKKKKTYDMVWSAGLFDYLNDRQFSYLIKRFYENLKDEGQMIIGNFSDKNPTKKVMEIMTEWYLNHRSHQHLTQLAINAGINDFNCIVEEEPLGINLFLKLVKL